MESTESQNALPTAPLTRKEDLLQAVDEMLACHADWQAKTDKPFVTKQLERIIDEVVTLFSYGDIPGDLRTLTIAVLSMAPHWDAWKAVADDNHQSPGLEFWTAFAAAQSARQATTARPERRLEPVKELSSYSPPTGPAQICRMYGWFDANGQPEYWKVRDEMDHPGKWSYDLYPDKWMPPHEKATKQKEAEQFAIVERVRQARAARLEASNRVAKESYEALHALPGMTLTQIAMMKKVGIAEAADELQRLGLSPLPMTVNAHSMDGVMQEKPAVGPLGPSADDMALAYQAPAAIVDPEAALQTVEDQILFYAKQGYSNAEVAEMVNSPELPVSTQKVAAIVRHRGGEKESWRAPLLATST